MNTERSLPTNISQAGSCRASRPSTITCAIAATTSATSAWTTPSGQCEKSTQATWLAPSRAENQVLAVGLPCIMYTVTSPGYSYAVRTVTTIIIARRTVTRRSVGTTGRNHTGGTTASTEDATIVEGAAVALQLAMEAVGELNGAPSTTPPATTTKSV